MKSISLVLLLLSTDVLAQSPVRQAVLLDDGSLLEGTIESFGKVVRITPLSGSARIVLNRQVEFIGESRESVYAFVSRQVDEKSLDGARKLAVWCEKAGLNQKAILHARSVLALQSDDKSAKDLIARLEKLPVAMPFEKKPIVTQQPPPTPLNGAAASFATIIQPILSNQCASCHADRKHAGTFKLSRITEGYSNPEANAENLKAVAAQLNPDNPGNSPLLTYSLIGHGGQKRAAFSNRDAAAYRNLQAWVLAMVPKAAVTTGFTPAPNQPPSTTEQGTDSPPGTIVGTIGQSVPAFPSATASPPPMPPSPASPIARPSVAAPPPPARPGDPFDPESFNRLPKKSAK